MWSEYASEVQSLSHKKSYEIVNFRLLHMQFNEGDTRHTVHVSFVFNISHLDLVKLQN